MAVSAHPDPVASICIQNRPGVNFLLLIRYFCEYTIGQAEKTLLCVCQPNAALPITGDPLENLQDYSPRQGLLRADDVHESSLLNPGKDYRIFKIPRPPKRTKP